MALACLALSVDASQGPRLRMRAKGGGSGGGGTGLITQSDISYLGSCVLPSTLTSLGQSGMTTARADESFQAGNLENEGLAYLAVAGTPYLITTADARFTANVGGTSGGGGPQGLPYRFHCSSLSTTPTYPTATLDEFYGDAFDCKRVDVTDACNNEWWSGPGGLYVRDNGGSTELWWTASPAGYGNDGDYATLGYSTLSIGGSSATGQAEYKFQNYDQHWRTGSFFPIPASWQSRFGGHTMMLTNKGVSSNHGFADPSIIALDFPSGAHLSTVASTDFKRVMGQSDVTRCTNTSTRLLRPAWLPALHFNYWDKPYPDTGDCTPDDSVAWTTANSIGSEAANSMLFIDTGTKYGVLDFHHWVLGGSTYIFAVLATAGTTTGWAVIDPAQLAEVYAGSRLAKDVTYNSSWSVHYPVVDYTVVPAVEVTASASIQATATNQRYRITLSAPLDLTGLIVSGYGFGNGYFNRGYYVYSDDVSIPAVVTPNYVYDVCSGQSCACPNPPGCVTPIVNTASSNGTIQVAHGGDSRAKANGAVWMPTNSACGQDNTFAVAVDADDGGGLRRYIHCYKVN